MIEVLAPGPYATVQDLGRHGYAHLGVPRSGAADEASLRLGNRLVGNPETAAGIELTYGGARLKFHSGAWVAVTGAPCPLTGPSPTTGGSGPSPEAGPSPTTVGPEPSTDAEAAGPSPVPVETGRRTVPVETGRSPVTVEAGRSSGPVGARRPPTLGAGMNVPFWVPAGSELRFGAPIWGLRTYLAVRGGIAVEPVLGSRSTDSLSGLGPAPLRQGTVLPVGGSGGLVEISVDLAPAGEPPPAVLRIVPGPRDDWFAPDALAELCAEPYEVSQDSNRVGVRLRGRELTRAREGELPSEGMVTGAVQVPPSGQPIVFLADHPPTGGYPVIGVVREADLPIAAQLRPGDSVRFTLRPGRPRT
ncbi:biotin-dependent carboxyltransferase family protein [Nonomuraea aurantiaca]|uniref:5-oxoprolinase subunit C family protein n=1 Tax=Nonomuraea aurantiaca TaxID=2878562 RepID=UPI001CD98CBA|nr:biotin-dependent carboxyltransferase family protein [Nonomuraea aurantiaca]MCA2219826.1 biotin-dependent carboxyltransferase family protein [Nonomuraea aurantiaca]